MPFNGSGGFVAVAAPDFPAVSGQVILASQFNNVLNDVFQGLGQAMVRDGQSSATGNLPMGGFKHTGVGDASAAGQYLVYGQASAVLAGLSVQITGVGEARVETLSGTNSVAFGFNSTGVTNAWGGPHNAGFLGIKASTPIHFGVGGAAKFEVSSTGIYPTVRYGMAIGSNTREWGNIWGTQISGAVNGDFGNPPVYSLQAANVDSGAAVVSYLRKGLWGIVGGLDTDNSWKLGGYSDGIGYFRATIGRTFAEFPGTLKASNITSELNSATVSAKFILRNRTSSAISHTYGALLWDAWRDVADPSYVGAIAVVGDNPAGNNGLMNFHVGNNGTSSFPALAASLGPTGNFSAVGTITGFVVNSSNSVAVGTSLTVGTTATITGLATVGGSITAGGLIYGMGGGIGLGRITVSASPPSGGSDGDIHFRT